MTFLPSQARPPRSRRLPPWPPMISIASIFNRTEREEKTMAGMLIRGGRVVDGTGAPAYRADVRVRDGFISEIAPSLAPVADERVFDAEGCEVTPGFIEVHTH